MKKKTKKVIAMLLAAVMVLSTGCANTTKKETTEVTNESTTAQTTTQTTAAKPTEATAEPVKIVEISMMVYDRGHEYAAGNSLTDNELTRWINKQMEPQGVHVNFIPVTRSDADNQVNLMLAAGTAPDIIRTYDRQRVATYGSQGGLVDLTPYLNQLDADYLSENAEAIAFTKFDGAQYAIPGVYSYHGKGHETYLRQDLVEAMGMKMPTNRDELIEVLYAMKEKYPDITPYAFSGKKTNGNYTNWLLSYTSRANERDNYIYEPTFTIVLKPGHKEGLKQLNQFVLHGIISPDFALDTDSTKYYQDIANGKVGFVMDGSDDVIEAYATAEDPNYHMVEGDFLKNADGNYEVPSQDGFSHYVYVPKASEDRIDAIVKFLAWLSVEENQMKVAKGGESIGFDYVDGFPVSKKKDEMIANGGSTNPSDLGFLYANFKVDADKLVSNYQAKYPDVPAEVTEGKIKSQYSNWYDKCLIPAVLETDGYVPLLQSLIVEFVFKCMCAPEGQFDAVYEKEYQILVDNHLQEVLDERAAWYDANMSK